MLTRAALLGRPSFIDQSLIPLDDSCSDCIDIASRLECPVPVLHSVLGDGAISAVLATCLRRGRFY